MSTNSDAGRPNFRTSVLQLERPGDPRVFGEQTRAEAAQIIARYPVGQSRSALLPLLHLVQSVQGYVTADGIAFCADALAITKAQVSAVVTFYTMYKRAPTGEYLVSVCTNTLCGMLGGDEIFAELSATLGVGHNETTADATITLEHAECLAACDYAPVVTVNYEFFDNQSVESAGQLVAALRDGERPPPTRGAPLCSFKQIERQIAGFFDAESLAQDAGGSGVPTEVGVHLAIERSDTAPSYALERTELQGTGTEPSSEAPEPPSEPPALEAPKSAQKSAQKPKRSRRGSARQTSANDAPLQTSLSDEQHPHLPYASAEPEPGKGT